jgi:hypothetical protein
MDERLHYIGKRCYRLENVSESDTSHVEPSTDDFGWTSVASTVLLMECLSEWANALQRLRWTWNMSELQLD